MGKYPTAVHLGANFIDIDRTWLHLLKVCDALPLTLVCSGAQLPAAERGLSLFSPEAHRYICHDGCAVKTYQLCGATPSPAGDSDSMRQVDPYSFKTLHTVTLLL